ncbi:MAG: glycosyltransferase [Bacteroidetes bacterium]|nr:glycosyltransferase [Bacteroidota bacterium]
MYNLLQIIFIVSVSLIIYTYALYPFIVIILSKIFKKSNLGTTENFQPNVAIIMAAYNEDKIISQKLDSIFNTNYPLNKIKIYIGNDSSTDNTELIIKNYQQKHENITIVNFKARSGKIKIINELYKLVTEPVLIFTDANVLFTTNTINNLISPLNTTTVATAAKIIKTIKNANGIAFQEIEYLNYENKIKLAESKLFKTVIGIEGGCFAINKTYFPTIPDNFIVDDFYVTLSIIKKHKNISFAFNAICYEDTSTQSDVEFKRKVRISTGNFQNLFAFKSLLAQFWRGSVLAYISHKVIRWNVPFLMLISLLTTAILALNSKLYFLLFFAQLILIQIAVIVNLFNIKFSLLKFISHFYYMNFALFLGFKNYIKGVKTSIWEPTKRTIE